jgi:hypothetical protein
VPGDEVVLGPAEVAEQLGAVEPATGLVDPLPPDEQAAEHRVHAHVEPRVGDDAGALFHVAEPGQGRRFAAGGDVDVQLPQRAADHARVQLAEPLPDAGRAAAVEVAALAAHRGDDEVGHAPVVGAQRQQPRAPGRRCREQFLDDRPDGVTGERRSRGRGTAVGCHAGQPSGRGAVRAALTGVRGFRTVLTGHPATGRVDFVGYNTDGDGLLDSAEYDNNFDGNFESHNVDTTGDGWFDRQYTDTDGDGRWDYGAADTNNDGQWGPRGQGHRRRRPMDRTATDTDYNGTADTVHYGDGETNRTRRRR